MKKIILPLSLITIITLNLILLLAAVYNDLSPIQRAFDTIVLVMDISMLISSFYFGVFCMKKRMIRFAYLFFLNIILYLVAIVSLILKFEITLWALFLFDIYCLNLYLLFVPIYIEK